LLIAWSRKFESMASYAMFDSHSQAASIVIVSLLAACTSTATHSGDGAPSRDTSTPVAPDSTFADITFTMETSVGPGSEIQECKLVQLPSDRGEIAVPAAESHFTPGSHHFLVYRTNLTTMPDGGGNIVDCTNATAESASFVTGSYFEAQQPDMKHELPAGVAHLFKPGEVVVMQTHYLNASTDVMAAKVTFTLHTMDPAKVEHEAGTILFSNFGLQVPPLSKVSQMRTCPVSTTEDMHVALLWSHMHKRGVHFVATTDDPGVEGPLYETDDWSEPQPRVFSIDPPTTIHAGAHITFACDYDNSTTSSFVYGPSADTNEMCILHGMYWPRVDPVTEFCLAGTGPALPGVGTAADAGAGTDAGSGTDAGGSANAGGDGGGGK
jgi:hypothetical protein